FVGRGEKARRALSAVDIGPRNSTSVTPGPSVVERAGNEKEGSKVDHQEPGPNKPKVPARRNENRPDEQLDRGRGGKISDDTLHVYVHLTPPPDPTNPDSEP